MHACVCLCACTFSNCPHDQSHGLTRSPGCLGVGPACSWAGSSIQHLNFCLGSKSHLPASSIPYTLTTVTDSKFLWLGCTLIWQNMSVPSWSLSIPEFLSQGTLQCLRSKRAKTSSSHVTEWADFGQSYFESPP